MSSTQEVGDIFGQEKGSAQAMLRSPTVLILCVGLWGMNIFFFRLFGLDYKYILNLDLVEIEKEEKDKATKESRRRRDGYIETSTSENNSNDPELMETATKNSGSAVKKTRAASPASMMQDTSSINDIIPISQFPQSGSSTPSDSFPQGDIGSAILWYKLVLFSIILLLILHFSTHYWMDHLHRNSIGAVAFFYSSMMLYIFFPVRQNEWLRRSFVIVVKRTWALLHPRCSCIHLFGTNQIPRRIPFVDVFYADAMCSLSKVFFDWGMLAHQAAHYPDPVPAATHNIVVPSLCAALPYLIRARQCLIMHRVGKLQRDPKRYQHLMNAFKYSTSMYPLILSAYLKTFSEGDDTSLLDRILVALLTINASYSLYWDIVMDWGMMQDPYRVAQTACRAGMPSTLGIMDEPVKGHTKTAVGPSTVDSCHHICLRPRLRYGLTLTALIVTADSFLRFSWMLKFVPKLFPSNDAFVLCTQFLEVFRRAMWNLLRVEWENIKQTRKATSQPKAPDSLSDVDPLEHFRDGEEQQELMFGGDVVTHANNNTIGLAGSPQKEDPPGSSLEMKILR
mmetsp:Transcript_23289/g.54901  ORF Transcript_23289/g.54901 Transcript_23289/m.54901 type:complete len:565 (-) Transcript_23289:408-2102(-)